MASVNLILLEDVDNLGLAGDEVRVAAGYARNFLMPRGKGAKITKGAKRQFEARKEQIETQRRETLENAQAVSAKIVETAIVIKMEASDDGALFGSVSNRVIHDELEALGFELDVNAVRLSKTIKALGEYDVKVHLHKEVEPTIKVTVAQAE